jgi:DNA-binding XRE family transcriptional regulator
VVGDRRDIQSLAIRERVRVIVVTGGLTVHGSIIEEAKRNKVSLLISPHDSATTAMLSRASITVDHMIHRDFLSFRDEDSLAFLSEEGRRYLLSTRRHALQEFQSELTNTGWQRLPENLDVQVKLLQRQGVHYLLARSKPRRHKERAMRRRQRRGLAKALKKLLLRINAGRLKQRDKIVEAIGRLKARFPRAHRFVTTKVSPRGQFSYVWNVAKFKDALVRDGAYLLRSNQAGWSAQEFWETYMQLTVVERAFRVLKTNLLLRPIWHQYSGRCQAHVFVCVLAYALWKTLDHLAKRAGVAQRTVVDAEAGRTVPQPATMRKLAEALGVDPMEIDEFRAAAEGRIEEKAAA